MIVETHRGPVGVLDVGQGPAVVLLHPLALAAEMWRPLIETSPGVRFVAVDAPGHGESPWDGKPYSVEDAASDVAAVIESLGLQRPGLLGLSMGGTTAVTLAGTRPDLLSALALVDTTACYGEGREQTWEERAVRATSVPRPQQLSFQVDRWFSPSTVDRAPEVVERVSRIFTATDSEAHAAACRAMGAADTTGLLACITVPTLIVVGSDDYATPPEMARQMHEGIPGSRLEVLDGARHLSVFDDERTWPMVLAHFTANVPV